MVMSGRLMLLFLFQMGMTGNTSPFGQPFSQTGGQQMGAPGVNPQLPSKQSMVNSLPPFAADIKNASVTNVPNMVSCPWSQSCGSPVGASVCGFSSC